MTGSVQDLSDGPISVAARWTKAVLKEHDLRAAWPMMAVELRRGNVEAWLAANAQHPALIGQSLDALRDDLSAKNPISHPLWGGFAVTFLGEIREKWNHINPDHCGFLSEPRLIDLDRELVVYVDTGTADSVVLDGPEGEDLQEGEEFELSRPWVGFVMHHAPSGWEIEGFEAGVGAES